MTISFCPRWSAFYQKETPCLQEKCTDYLPPEEIGGEKFEGMCSSIGILNCLSEISLSLGIISGRLEIKLPDSEDSEVQNQPEESLYG
jgi:hypothetical protein